MITGGECFVGLRGYNRGRAMPTEVIELPARLDPPRRKRWTRSEYETLFSLGTLNGQKLELVEGELIDKMGKNRPHSNSSRRLHEWLVGVFGWSLVGQEEPIDVAPEDNPTSEPEPDLIVARRDLSGFTTENPRPEDLQLVVEVAESTLGFDLTTKAALYARAGIPDYWVLDIGGRRMIVHLDPQADREPQAGRYASVVAYNEDESVAPLGAPKSLLLVGDVFV